MRSHKQALAAQCGPDRSEESTAQLLDLVHEQRPHPPRGKHHGAMLLPMPVGVLKVVALIFQRSARFIFNRPPRPATAHALRDVPRADPQVRHPTEVLHLVSTNLPLLDAMDSHVCVRCIERHGMHQAEAMEHTHGAVVPLRIGDAPSVLGCLSLLEHLGMIAFFDAEDSATPSIVQGLDMGSMGTQTVFGDDALERWVILAQRGNEALGGIARTIVLRRTILLHNRFGPQRHHGTHVRMDQRRAQHLMIRGERPVTVDLAQARRTVHRLGGTIPRAIESQYGVAIQTYHLFKRLAPLEVAQDALARRPERRRPHRIESLAPVRVAGDMRHARESAHIALRPFFIKGEERG